MEENRTDEYRDGVDEFRPYGCWNFFSWLERRFTRIVQETKGYPYSDVLSPP